MADSSTAKERKRWESHFPVLIQHSTLVTRQFTNCEGKHDGIER